MKQIKVQCPAKINLTLKVLNKRDDGFHNIESIMQTISLYDYLTIDVEPSENIEIILNGNSKEIPYNEKNLVYKAVKLFLEETGKTGKISIYIEKNIPVSAGLAGGSTDAAGTLFGLNEIFEKPLNETELHKLCAKLGSDLNVCLKGGKILAKGRGEIIEPLEFEEFKVSLIKPVNLGISAKEAYEKLEGKKVRGLEDKLFYNNDISEIKQEQQNDTDLSSYRPIALSPFKNHLEWAIIDDYKELQTIKKLYPNSMMSGSGSTYFVINDEFKSLDGYWIMNGLKSIDKGVCIKNDLLN